MTVLSLFETKKQRIICTFKLPASTKNNYD